MKHAATRVQSADRDEIARLVTFLVALPFPERVRAEPLSAEQTGGWRVHTAAVLALLNRQAEET